jgi:CDP-paratose 2-epimerase
MKIAIIGGAGFIGINSAYYFINNGHEVTIIDNLSRVGSDYNLKQIQELHHTPFIEADIRNYEQIKSALASLGELDGVLLLAGQVAVTTSVTNPREDFEINALGTFNVLEALRNNKQAPLLIYSSTNKVYGKMEEVGITMRNGRYEYEDLPQGVGEDMQLDFYSPYGCSKGTGDQYVRDYSRMYGIPTVVVRQSCIYGNNQFGIEDQGWVAWFTIATLLGKQISVFGDGNQIRDVLFVSDLVRLYDLAIQNKEKCAGKIYNVGGGPQNTLSLNELISILSKRFNKEIVPLKGDWRPGDQKVFISNIDKVKNDLGWSPQIDIHQGINKMAEWIEANADILNHYVFKNK